MDKIGEYIPLIIIVALSLYSFVKKSGKKMTEEEANKTSLPKGIPQKNVSIPQAKPKPQAVVSKPKMQKSTNTFNTAPPIAFFDEIIEEKGLVLDFNDADELKKGIIFAEIFNRKY